MRVFTIRERCFQRMLKRSNGPGVTWTVTRSPVPLAALAVTVYVPAFVYLWRTSRPLPRVLSPNFHVTVPGMFVNARNSRVWPIAAGPFDPVMVSLPVPAGVSTLTGTNACDGCGVVVVGDHGEAGAADRTGGREGRPVRERGCHSSGQRQ